MKMAGMRRTVCEAVGDHVSRKGYSHTQARAHAFSLALAYRPEGGEGVGVANGADGRLEVARHDLLVLTAAEGARDVGGGCGEKRGHSEVEFLRRGDGNATDDGDEAEDLGKGDLGLVRKVANEASKHRLPRLDNLTEGNGTRSHSVHRSTVRHRRPEAEGRDLHELGKGHLGSRTRVRRQPQEGRIDRANHQLDRREGECEFGATARLAGLLVEDVVIVVACRRGASVRSVFSTLGTRMSRVACVPRYHSAR